MSGALSIRFGCCVRSRVEIKNLFSVRQWQGSQSNSCDLPFNTLSYPLFINMLFYLSSLPISLSLSLSQSMSLHFCPCHVSLFFASDFLLSSYFSQYCLLSHFSSNPLYLCPSFFKVPLPSLSLSFTSPSFSFFSVSHVSNDFLPVLSHIASESATGPRGGLRFQ